MHSILIAFNPNTQKLRNMHCCACGEWANMVLPTVFHIHQTIDVQRFSLDKEITDFLLCYNCFEWFAVRRFALSYFQEQDVAEITNWIEHMPVSRERCQAFKNLFMQFRFHHFHNEIATDFDLSAAPNAINRARNVWDTIVVESVRQHNERAHQDLLGFSFNYPEYFDQQNLHFRPILKSIYDQAFGRRVRMLTPKQIEAYRSTIIHMNHPEHFPNIMLQLESLTREGRNVLGLNQWEIEFVDHVLEQMAERGYWTRAQKEVIGAILIGAGLMTENLVLDEFGNDDLITMIRSRCVRRTNRQLDPTSGLNFERFQEFNRIQRSSVVRPGRRPEVNFSIFGGPIGPMGETGVGGPTGVICSLASDYQHRMREKMRELGISEEL